MDAEVAKDTANINKYTKQLVYLQADYNEKTAEYETQTKAKEPLQAMKADKEAREAEN